MATTTNSEGGRTDRYLAELRREFPGLRVLDKRQDAFSKLLNRLVRLVTFGGQSAYMTRYVTTIGRTIYLPEGWEGRSDEDCYITLRHEAVHLRQFRRYTLIGMSILYLLPVFPLGLALGRARLEWEAYAETLRATAEVHGLPAARDPALQDRIVRQFTTAAYGWMWPFPRVVRKWIDAVVREIESTDVSG